MSQRRVRPLAACTIAAAAAMLGSAAVPGIARADDGGADPLASLATAPADAPQAVIEEALATVTEATPVAEPVEAPDEAPPAPETPAAPPATTSSEAPATDPAEPVTDTAVEPDAAEDEAAEPDTTPIEDDIAVDTPSPAATTAAAAPEAAPSERETPPAAPATAPKASPAPASTHANVNVSVRIGSPGDNGPVTQVNVLDGPSGAVQVDSQKPKPPASEAVPPETPAAPTGDSWYWEWDCLGLTSPGAISPFDSGGGSVPTTWTWIWNCGDKSAQYHDESNDGYRQINTNIAIRIASPGDDASVTQVNVATGVSVSVPRPSLPSAPAAPLPAPASPLPAPAVPVIEIGDAPELSVTLPIPVVVGDITLPAPVATTASTLPTDDAVAIPPAAPSAWPAMVARLPFGAGARAWLPVAPTVDGPAAPAGRRETLSTVPAGGGRPVARAGETTTRPKPHAASKRRPAPRWRPAPLQRPAAAPVPTASAAGVAGGGSSGSGLPFLLALPFVAALLDLARRVAFERATWPTGHRRRAPDRPG